MASLPCLSLRQPWAWTVTHGTKDVENRRWNTRFRGRFLIHASTGMTRAEYHGARAYCAENGLQLPDPQTLLRGGIVGCAELVEVLAPCAEDDGWHMAGQYGFVLRSRRPLPFRPLKGRLGLFGVELTASETELLALGR